MIHYAKEYVSTTVSTGPPEKTVGPGMRFTVFSRLNSDFVEIL